MRMQLKRATILSHTMLLLVGVGAGYAFTTINTLDPSQLGTQSNNEFRSLTGRGHAYTNPLLACTDIPAAITIGERKELESKVHAYIDENVSKGTITEASVYYRDLNNGPWFGIHEDSLFDPASLFKVPLAMSFLWLENEGSDVLNEQIQFKSPQGITVGFFPPEVTLEEGKIYTVWDLIENMIVYSDNEASVILSQYLGTDERNKLYEDLGLSVLNSKQEFTVDVRTYASFFRLLYNATYIGLQNSEWMLEALSKSPFKGGIVAGVPQNTRVAHKFGEHFSDSNGERIFQLHDCGIVYAPEKPYMLCVMTRGKDMTKLPDFIAEVSRMVYRDVVW